MIVQAYQTRGGEVLSNDRAARLILLGAGAHPGLNLGGILLVVAGVAYLAYSVLKRR